MIVNFKNFDTNEGELLYSALFEKLNAALDITIASPADYFANIEDIVAENNADLLRMPQEEETFKVDLNTRIIKVPNYFKKNGIGVVGDNKAEMIFFECDRYFDSMDLGRNTDDIENEINIFIKWQITKGKEKIEGVTKAFGKTVVGDKIVFGWIIDKTLTQAAGTINFAISFIQGAPEAEGYNEELDYGYVLNIMPTTLTVNPGFIFTSNNLVLDNDTVDDLDFLAAYEVNEEDTYLPVPKLVDVKTFAPNGYFVDENAYYNFTAASDTIPIALYSPYYPNSAIEITAPGGGTVSASTAEVAVTDYTKNMYYETSSSATKMDAEDRYAAYKNETSAYIKTANMTVAQPASWEDNEEIKVLDVKYKGEYTINQGESNEHTYTSAEKTVHLKVPKARKVTDFTLYDISGETEKAVNKTGDHYVVNFEVTTETTTEDDPLTDENEEVITTSYAAKVKLVVNKFQGMKSGETIAFANMGSNLGTLAASAGTGSFSDNVIELTFSDLAAYATSETESDRTKTFVINHTKNGATVSSDTITVVFKKVTE